MAPMSSPRMRAVTTAARRSSAAHIDALAEHKREARHHRGLDHLAHAAPAARTLMLHAAERGSNLGNITAPLLRLLDRYSAAELQAAIEETLANGVAPHQNPGRLTLQRRRAAREQCRPSPSNRRNTGGKDKRVTPHRLDIYDQLAAEADPDKQD